MKADKDAWRVLDAYFRDNPYFLTAHHLDSFDRFVDTVLSETVRSMNPIVMVRDDATSGKRYTVTVNVGERSVSMDRPTVVDPDGTVRPLYPNEARLKDLTYAANIYADVAVSYSVGDDDKDSAASDTEERFDAVHIGALPLMLHSRLCLLRDMPPAVLREMGECPDDRGGYFVVDGREKVIVTQEDRVKNRLYVRHGEASNKDLAFTAFMRCMPLDGRDVFPRTATFHVRAATANSRPNAIGVNVTHVDGGDVPLFVLFRALGVESDRAIMEHVVYDVDAPDEADVLDFLRASANDAMRRGVYDQRAAIDFLVPRTRFKTDADLKSVLTDDLFPNVGPDFAPKAMLLGYAVRRIVRVAIGKAPVSVLDDYKNKRLEPAGFKMGDLFRDVYNTLRDNCLRVMNAEFGAGAWRTSGDVRALVNPVSVRAMFPPWIVRDAMVRAMKGGAWGAKDDGKDDDKTEGVVQDLNRISYLTYVSHVRRVNNPVPRDVKMADPHRMLASHWGAVCPVESPDGPNIGLLNHLAVTCVVSPSTDAQPLMATLETEGLLTPVTEYATRARMRELRTACKVMVNDTWVAVTRDPPTLVRRVRELRRGGAVDRTVSVAWNIVEAEVHVHTDRGRCCRPLVVVVDGRAKEGGGKEEQQQARKKKTTTNDGMEGGGRAGGLQKLDALLEKVGGGGVVTWDGLFQAGALEMVDVEELLTRLVAMRPSDLAERPTNRYTHCEIHPACILSAATNTYPLLNHNNAAYNVLCLAQFKQAIGTYVTNFNARMDTLGYVLHHPQRPLVSTDFADKLCGGRMAHGENVIVAIATYTGYNQEDSVLLNLDAVERGRFALTHYATERFAESPADADIVVMFGNAERLEAEGREVRNVKPAGYGKLGPDGLPSRNAFLREEDIMMGMVAMQKATEGVDGGVMAGGGAKKKKGSSKKATAAAAGGRSQVTYADASRRAGRHFGGCTVDRVFTYTHPKDGVRACKLRLRQVRQPVLGDKMGSRFGQKGVVGMMLRSQDMPFSHASGLVPDVILNPNAFPKRMTVAHILESLLGKTAALKGARYNANTFDRADVVGEAAAFLDGAGMEQHGDEVLYNGRTGEQMECKVFVGVNYYGRLKHMVEDKYQYRTRGPVNAIVRQPTKGGDGGGGLRIGEMEQNALLAHGVSGFVKESFMDRSDRHRVRIDAEEGLLHNDGRAGGDAEAPHRAATVEMPYAFKLMQQELNAMALDTRLEVGSEDDNAEDGEDGEDGEDSTEDGMDEGDDIASDDEAADGADADDVGDGEA